jgi:hypothetical protein
MSMALRDLTYILKGTLSRDFRPSVFFVSINPQGPDSHAKAVSHMALISPRNSLTPLCRQLFLRISSRIIRHTVFLRKSDSAVHGTAVSLTPLCKYDNAVTLDLIFERLWLVATFKGNTYRITYIGKLPCTIPIIFTLKIWKYGGYLEIGDFIINFLREFNVES